VLARAIQQVGANGKKANAAQGRRQVEAQLAKLENKQEMPAISIPRNIEPQNLQKPPPQLNPAKVLDHIDDVLRYYSRWDNVHQRRIAALWTASTWFADKNGQMLFNAHPRLFFIDEKNSGKTQAMMITRAMSRNPTDIITDTTAYGLRDALNAGQTVFLDEIDRKITSGRANQQIQSYIAAYKPGMSSLNGREGGNNQRGTFGPMVLAAKPRIRFTGGEWIEDLFERSLIVAPGKYANPLDHVPELDEDFEYVTHAVSRVLEVWTAQTYKDLQEKTLNDAIAKYGLDPKTDEGGRMLSRIITKAKYHPIHTVPDELTARMRELASAILVPADYAVDTTGEDPYRWAKWGREAVQNVLLGQGDDAGEIISGLDAKFKEMGL
jgi:hypothetical protein